MRRYPAWSNSTLKELKRRRRNALRAQQRHPSVLNHEAARLALRCYRAYNRLLYDRYISRVQRSLRRRPTGFWSFVKSRQRNNMEPSSIRYKAILAKTDTVCETFARKLSDVFASYVPDPISCDQLHSSKLHRPATYHYRFKLRHSGP